MRCPVESLAEKPQEMVARQAGFSRNPSEIERQVTALVDQDASPAQPPVYVLVRSPADLVVICGRHYWIEIFLISIRCLGLSPSTSAAAILSNTSSPSTTLANGASWPSSDGVATEII